MQGGSPRSGTELTPCIRFLQYRHGVDVPKETTADAILQTMRQKHGIMLAGSFDSLAGQVIRIGHMGSNANVVDMIETAFMDFPVFNVADCFITCGCVLLMGHLVLFKQGILEG